MRGNKAEIGSRRGGAKKKEVRGRESARTEKAERRRQRREGKGERGWREKRERGEGVERRGGKDVKEIRCRAVSLSSVITGCFHYFPPSLSPPPHLPLSLTPIWQRTQHHTK